LPLPQHSPDSVILFDQGHFNSHQLTTTYARFASIAANNGWFLENLPGKATAEWLARGRILVIVNALNVQNVEVWELPTPSAFDNGEILAIAHWVENGGGLLLVTDHMPFAGASADLAATFGATFSNGFAFDRAQLAVPNICLDPSQVHIFSRDAHTLGDHAVTTGVQSIATFTGSAFQLPGSPILTFNSTSVALEPRTAWAFAGAYERSVAGWLQGALKDVAKGRVAIFSEAAMFAERMCDATTQMGMNHPLAADNARLLQNVLQWLGRR
jgi:hypothetical protein